MSDEDALTLPSVQRDFTEWRRDRRHFAVWALEVDLPAVRAASATACAALAPLLRGDYRRQPHLTLGICGFAVSQPRHADDFGPAALAAQTRALATAGVASFHIAIGPAASFSSAAYLQIADLDGGIARLRRALVQCTPAMDVAPPPHVSVGLYAVAAAMSDVHARLRRLDQPPLSLRISALACMVYEAADIGGPLSTVRRLILPDGPIGAGVLDDSAALLSLFGAPAMHVRSSPAAV